MANKIVIRATWLWNGVDTQAIPHGAVLVEGSLIRAIGTATEMLALPHDEVTSYNEATLLPGLIDCHNHLSMDPTLENYLDRMSDSVAELTLRATAMMRKDLYAGVTTTRCCGDKELLDIACRKAVEQGLVEGPRLLVATRGIRAPRGQGVVGYGFDGVDEIRKAIQENLAAGADLIKIYITGTLKGEGTLPSYLSREEIEVAIRESHRGGARVAAHCVGGEGLDWALESGIDTLEHGYHISDTQIHRLAKSDTWLIFTPSPFLTKARIEHLPGELIPGHFAEQEEVARRMSAAIAGGVFFAVGTDAMHGCLAEELAYLVDLGAEPHAALTAATHHGAKVCGKENEVGRLEPNMLADLIVVEGNPLEEITALKRIRAVMKGGQWMRTENDQSPS